MVIGARAYEFARVTVGVVGVVVLAGLAVWGWL